MKCSHSSDLGLNDFHLNEFHRAGDKQAVLDLARALVAEESPSNREGGVARIVEARMRELGYDQVYVDEMGNVVGLIRGTGTEGKAAPSTAGAAAGAATALRAGALSTAAGPGVLFDGHMDTIGVTPREAWTHDPFAGEVEGDPEGGRLYGRGTADMKGSIAAMVEGIGRLARGARRPAADVWVVASVAEEIMEGVALAHVLDQIPARTGRPRPGRVVIGEATGLGLAIGQRGRAELVVETVGVPAHSSTPERGVNAVYLMTEVIRALRALTPPDHPLLGRGVLELTDIISTPYPATSVVPDRCSATYDRRVLAGETPATVLEQVEAVVGQVRDRQVRNPTPGGPRTSGPRRGDSRRGGPGRGDSRPGGPGRGGPCPTGGCGPSQPGFSGSVRLARADFKTYTGFPVAADKFLDAWVTAPDSPFAVAAAEGLAWAGLAPSAAEVTRTSYRFCTNGSAVGGKPGHAVLGFGPGSELQAHAIDEFVEVEQLYAAARGYLGIALAAALAAGPS